MKILVVEYITGGGLNKQQLPDSLAKEGLMMLQGLLDNLSTIPDVKVEILLDWRFLGRINTTGINTILVYEHHNFIEKFTNLAQYCDAVWPIAPESDGVLQNLCRLTEAFSVKLLTSPAKAVASTANKLKTYQQLRHHHIATIATEIFQFSASYPEGLWMVKSIDGVGCADSYLCSGQSGFNQLSEHNNYIIQPHVEGKKTSLSCLYKQGQAWLLSVNLQHFIIQSNQYHLAAITVNNDKADTYQEIAKDIGKAFPDLWGYVGIDLIETAEQILVLEINPRLTSSFVGITDALGLNVAELVLSLTSGFPEVNIVCNKSVMVNFNKAQYVQ